MRCSARVSNVFSRAPFLAPGTRHPQGFQSPAARGWRRWLLVLCALSPLAQAQQAVPEDLQQFTESLLRQSQAEAAENDQVGSKWRGVPRIKGTATISYRSKVDEAHLMPSNVGQTEDDVTVRFELVRVDDSGTNNLFWRAREISLAGGRSARSTFRTGGEDVSMTEDARFQGPADRPEAITLSLSTEDGRWEISTPGHTRDEYAVKRRYSGWRTENMERVSVNETETELDNVVQSLTFEGTIADIPGTTRASLLDEGPIGDWTTRTYAKRARIEFWPDYDDYALEVRIDGYADWRPLGRVDQPGQPGAQLTARALVLPEGDAPPPLVRAIRFELLDVSREPGVCMNWPLAAKDSDPDLRLAVEGESPGTLSDEDQRLEVTRPQVDELDRPFALARIDSYDFGARATLKVTAELLDGRELVGEFVAADGAAAQDLVRLPKMAGPDWIAAAWKEKSGVNELSDSDDDESKPVGDGSRGDGYTLYEEYRGWVENGRHIEGDPKTKDFLVRDESEGLYVAGARKFGRITGLKVRYRFAKNEFSRVMNRNHADGPHLIDQHGVIIRTQAGQTGFAAARGGPSSPARIEFVAMAQDSAEWDPGYLAATVAHELGHCVNIWHHGQLDEKVFWSLSNGQLFERNVDAAGPGVGPIRLRTENNTDLTASWIEQLRQAEAGSGWEMSLGKPGGQHSGFENCVMRYDCAQTYAGKTDPLLRYYGFDEPVGGAMCTSPEGTGVNAADHPPQSRYGNTTAGRGDCLHQIHVTDAAPARGRD